MNGSVDSSINAFTDLDAKVQEGNDYVLNLDRGIEVCAYFNDTFSIGHDFFLCTALLDNSLVHGWITRLHAKQRYHRVLDRLTISLSPNV